MPTEPQDPDASTQSDEDARMRRGTRDEKFEKPKTSGVQRLGGQLLRGSGGSNPVLNKIKSKLGSRLGSSNDNSSGGHPKNRGRQAGKKAGKFLGDLAKKGAGAAAKNPYVVAAILIVIFVVVLIVFIMNGSSGADPNAPKLTITKTGPTETEVDKIINYKIAVSYPGTAQNIVITDRIPNGTRYESSSPSAKFDPATNTATWNLNEYQASPGAILSNVNTVIDLNLVVTNDNIYLVNQAAGTVVGPGIKDVGGPVSGDIGKLLPNPLPPDPADTQELKTTVINAVNQDPRNLEAYKLSSRETGIPWQVFAGIHYREGNASPNSSIVSGRGIGGNEPDVVDGPGCASDAPRGITDGIAEPMAGGCGFSSLADSGIYAGILLKTKITNELTRFEDLVEGLSNYNGGGNANCGKTPYTGCPRLFYGEDDTYVMHLFDERHAEMYIVYCADYTRCDPPVLDSRPGTATAIKWVAQGIQ